MKRLKNIVPFLIGIFLILFFWRNTFLNITGKIHDWYDGAFMIWTMQNNIKHFLTLDFAHLYDTNAMYPFRDSLSFTDHLFVPSFFALLISFFDPNPLFQYNLISILNHLAVFSAFYLLAGRFSKKSWVKLLTALYGSFGPYFFSQFGHLQMVFMWPLILSLYFLLDEKRHMKSLILSGFFLGIQFLTGVYLGLIGLTVIGLFYASRLIAGYLEKRKFDLKLLRDFVAVFAVFLVVSAVSLFGYFKVNMLYHPVRNQAEFVTYSAHITDYVLNMFTPSAFNRYVFAPLIGRFNRHAIGEQAGFVGLVPLAVIIFSLRKRPMKKERSSLLVWLVLLIGFGFVFSLGPRMNWNGKYLVTPLPYWLVMKIFPPIAIMRAVSRWYFLVIFAVTVLFAIGLDRLKVSKTAAIVISLLFLFEFYPAPVQVTARDWDSPSYLYLHRACLEKPGAVLIYPFEYRDRMNDIGTYLSLKTNQLMSSTLYDCPTLSGFSSFEPPLFRQWQTDFDANGITDKNLLILTKNKFAFVLVNRAALSIEEKKNPGSVIHTKALDEVYRDNYFVIYKIAP